MPRFRVLVVDDHPDAARMACKLLGLLGHDAEHVTSSRDALAAFDRRIPDVAMLDLGLPEMSGFELARRFRQQRGSSIFLVAWSGWVSLEDQGRSVLAGFDRFLLKPVAVRTLQTLLEEVNSRSRLLASSALP